MLSDFFGSSALELLELEELGLLALGLALEPEAELPPLAWSFFVSVEAEPEAEPDMEPEGDVLELGDDGEVVEPDEEDAEPDGDVVEPDGEVVVPREAARSPLLSHAAMSVVPRATETASARVVNLMCRPPWLGYSLHAARIRPAG